MKLVVDNRYIGMINCLLSTAVRSNIQGESMGEHKAGYINIGGMVPPFYKAVMLCTIAAIKSRGIAMDQLNLLWTGVCRIAQDFGILDEKGNVTKEWEDLVQLHIEEIEAAHKANRGQPGHRKGKVEVKPIRKGVKKEGKK